MNGILREIFDDEYDITPKRGKRQREIDEQLCGEWDTIKAVFGVEFIDRLLALEGEQENWRAFHYYRAGFRLGACLMLEALET